MKVVLTQTEGYPHFALLDDLELPDLRIVQVTTADELAREIVDADVLYGFPTADLLAAGKALRWVQSPSAGVNYLQELPELVEGDVLLTNTRGAHGPSIGEHTFALSLPSPGTSRRASRLSSAATGRGPSSTAPAARCAVSPWGSSATAPSAAPWRSGPKASTWR